MELLKDAYIYCFKDNDRIIYVGKSHQPILNRLEQHLKNCHNEDLKKYLKSDSPPTFEIIYESHNEITEDVLKSIEKSYIETLKPECNKEGVIFPYGAYSNIKKHLGVDDILNNKNTVSDQDIDIILKNNPQIAECKLLNVNDEVERIEQLKDCPDMSKESGKRYLKKALEEKYGKLNNFNEKKYFNPYSGDFQQKAWVVRNKETKELRFLTNDEKLNGLKSKDGKETITQCRILYHTLPVEELCEVAADLGHFSDKAFLEKDLDLGMYYAELSFCMWEVIKCKDYYSLYFPLKVIKIYDNLEDEQKFSLAYDNPLLIWAYEQSCKRKEESSKTET